MPRGDVIGFKTNSRVVPAVVEAQYDTNGDVVADASGYTGVTTVDVLLLGVDAGRRSGVAYNADVDSAAVNEAGTFA